MNEKKRKTKKMLTYVALISLCLGIMFTGTPVKKVCFFTGSAMFFVQGIMEFKSQEEWKSSFLVAIFCFITAYL